ncbi:MAG: arylsulfatase [Planctomycetes bacterium]|nr:arylsulfatase [Planctomycetota bacterium]
MALLSGFCVLATSTAAGEKPNIIFIMADDLGYGDLGCYNRSSKVPTPNIDRVAAEGMRFTDAHSPSAVCTPTRYGVLTGRYSWRSRLESGVLWGYSRALIEPGRTTVASLLNEQGYTTGAVGKWHLGFQPPDPKVRAEKEQPRVDYSQPLRPGPLTVGFDYFYGIPASLDMEPYVYVENDRAIRQPTELVERSEHRRNLGGGFWRAGPIAPGFKHVDVLPVLTQKAVAFIERQWPKKPFFLYFPLTAPHTPWLPTEEFRGRSGAGHYGDFVVQVDQTVGEVVDTLNRTGLAENSLLIFTSDNGSHWPDADIKRWGHDANGGRRGQKADIWEGGHRVPFLARWPGRISPGTTCNQTLCLTDLLATAAAVVGADLPGTAGEDSYNMLPALLGAAAKPIREATVHHSLNGTFAIRQGEWKLIEGLGSGGFTPPQKIEARPAGPAGQLYNLADDPAEKHNRYLDRPEIVRRLQALLDRYRTADRSRPDR